MPTESTTAILNWSSLQGTLLDGGYEVEECQSKTESSASFALRILGDRFTKASVRFFAPGGVPAEQLAIWTDACSFPQAGLSKPMGVGQLRLEGQTLRYVMFVEADETLADVLRERALTPEEVREIVRTAVDALGGLHSRGYVHAALSPKTILAVRDSILLSTLSLQRIGQPLDGAHEAQYVAPESGKVNSTPEADIWCLGASVFQALTQQPFIPEDAEQALTLPSPFHAVAYRCLEDDPHMRCSLSAVRAMLRGEQLDLVVRKKPAPAKPEESARTQRSEEVAPVAGATGNAPPLTFAAAAGAQASSGPTTPESGASAAYKTAPAPGMSQPSQLNGAAALSGADPQDKQSHAPINPPQPVPNGHAAMPNGAGTAPAKAVPTANASIAAAASAGALEEMYEAQERSTPPRDRLTDAPERTREGFDLSGELSDRSGVRPVRPRAAPADRVRPRPVLPPRPDPNAWRGGSEFPSPTEYKDAIARQSARTKAISYIALALVLVCCVFWLTLGGARRSQPTVHHAVTGTANQTSKQNWPARELGPNGAGQAATGTPATQSPSASSDSSAEGGARAAAPLDLPSSTSAPTTPGSAANWRVVAYTANHLADAQRRAQQIMAKHPGFAPEIFSPKGSGAPYLVVLGGQLDRDGAAKVRARARAAGMPRDTYIQNFSR